MKRPNFTTNKIGDENGEKNKVTFEVKINNKIS